MIFKRIYEVYFEFFSKTQMQLFNFYYFQEKDSTMYSILSLNEVK